MPSESLKTTPSKSKIAKHRPQTDYFRTNSNSKKSDLYQDELSKNSSLILKSNKPSNNSFLIIFLLGFFAIFSFGLVVSLGLGIEPDKQIISFLNEISGQVKNSKTNLSKSNQVNDFDTCLQAGGLIENQNICNWKNKSFIKKSENSIDFSNNTESKALTNSDNSSQSSSQYNSISSSTKIDNSKIYTNPYYNNLKIVYTDSWSFSTSTTNHALYDGLVEREIKLKTPIAKLKNLIKNV